MGYKSYQGFAQKYFAQQELQAVKYSVITYVWSMVDVFYCDTVVYMQTGLEWDVIIALNTLLTSTWKKRINISSTSSVSS